MPKPGDPGDSTQPLSESQVVAVTPNPPPIATNDQSIAWKGTVVSADEFAPAKPRPSRAKWVVIGALGAGAVGVGAYELVPRSNPPAPVVAPSPGSATVVMPPPVDAAPVVDAAVAIDAAEPPADAAVPQAVKPPAKPTKKKKPRPRGH